MNHLLSTRYRETVHLPSLSLLDLFKSAVILVSTTLIGFLFYELGFTDANIIALYLLGVLLVSVSTKSSICSFFAAVFSVLTFNFCFTNPRFSLHVYESGYPVTFLVMFLVSPVDRISSLQAEVPRQTVGPGGMAHQTSL